MNKINSTIYRYHLLLGIRKKNENYCPISGIIWAIPINCCRSSRLVCECWKIQRTVISFPVRAKINKIIGIHEVVPSNKEPLLDKMIAMQALGKRLKYSTLFCIFFRPAQTSTRVSITVWKHGKCFLFLKHILVNKFCKCTFGF